MADMSDPKPAKNRPASEGGQQSEFPGYLAYIIWTAFAAVLLYALLVLWAGWDEISQAASRVNLAIVLLILALTIIAIMVRFARWAFYLSRLGHRVPPFTNFQYFLASLLFCVTPARAGEAVRAVYLKPHNVPVQDSLSALFAERVTDASAMVVLGALVLAAFAGGSVFWIAAIWAAMALIIWRADDGIRLLHGFVAHRESSAIARFLDRLERGIDAARQLLSPRLFGIGFAMGAAGFCLMGLGLYAIAYALTIDIGPITAIGVYAAGMTVGAFSFLPGGIGSADIALTVFLATAGANSSDAIAAALLIRIATLWFTVLTGLLATTVVWLRSNGESNGPVH